MVNQVIDNEEDNILYELLIHTEWNLDAEVIGGDLSQGGSIFYRTLMQTPSHIANLFLKRSAIPPDLYRVLGSGSEWQLGVGAQGAVIAVLQDASLEIRAKKDEYTSVVGKNFNLYNDPFPKWRRVSWSSECSMVAVAYSNGAVEIFNTVGASLFTIFPPRFQESRIQVDTNNALAALIFSDVRKEKMKWASELITIDYYGNVRSYFVSPTEGYQESHTFSFHYMYPCGISAAVEIGSLVIVAGFCQYINDPNLRSNGLGHGISIWRMINDYPYYKQVPTIDVDEYTPPQSSFLHHYSWLPASSCDYIFRLCVSPLGRQVAALHISGSISIWDVPSLRKRKFWPLELQPGYEMRHSSIRYTKKSSQDLMASVSLQNHLVDVKWWSENAVILARFSGAVTVCSIHSLTNLLGDSPEFFEGVPQISETYDRCFLGLEMERTSLRGPSRSSANISESSELEESLTDDLELYEEKDLSFAQNAKCLIQSVLFWITDSERFRPSSKIQKLVIRTCRLLCLKSTTPLELFMRKIENEEYGEALALAHRYNLDCDLVYQQQWRKSPVTVTSIQDYLTKIRKRSWVLAECLQRVPDDIEAARELILYGLRGTELDTLAGIDEGTNDDEFVVSDLSLEYDEDLDLDPEEAQREAQEWAANDLKKRKEFLAKIDFHNLSKEQIEVVEARQNLLKYYDRLSAYEILLGGPHMASERYDPRFYEKFRKKTEVEATVDLARTYNWQGVEVMFTYHGEITLPHRLPILSQFPPTMGPYEYRSLLPECDLSGEVFDWEEDTLRDPDWCEDLLCREAVGVEPDTGLALLYDEKPHLQLFREVKMTSDNVSEWYKMRAKEIEEKSHFVDAALDLLKLGRERNVPGLQELQYVFDTLEVLVYEVGLNDFSLQKLEALDDLEKLKLLLSTSTSETYIQNIRRWGQTFLNHCESKEAGLGKKLLREYIVSTAATDLSIALKSIQHSQENMTDPILSGPEEVLLVALDSIYACENEFQLPRAFAILECLPVEHSKKESRELTTLYNLIDDLEDHLSAAEVFSSHSIFVSPATIRKIQQDEAQIKMLLTRLTRTAVRRDVRHSDSDWNKLLGDMLEIRQKVFSIIEPQICFEILTEALLTSGVKEYINFGGELLETREDGSPIPNPYLQKLPFDTSVRLIIKASTEYFNSSESYLDSDMNLARHCLNMIQSENEQISAELDLISSLEILPEIGISILPLQVRMCEDRIQLISKALKSRPMNHQIGSRILRLASLLRVCGNDEVRRRGKVLTLITEAAFQTGNYEAANGWCLQIVNGGHSEGWEICARLGRCESSKDFSLQAKFLDFALTHASFEYLAELLVARNEVELRLLYNKVSDRVDPNISLDSDDGFEDARTESDEESCEEWEDPSPELPPSAVAPRKLLFSLTKNIFSNTATSTSSFVMSVTSKRMLKNAIGWLRPLRKMTMERKSDSAEDVEDNINFTKQGCHAFYADLCPEAYVSRIGPSYRSITTSSTNPALDISFILLRIALIEESLRQGNTVHTNVTVVQEVVKCVFREDFLLGVSFLLLLTSPKEVRDILSSFPQTEISLQVYIYYYALQIYTSLYPWEKPGIAPVFLHPPCDVINCVRRILQKDITYVDDDVAAYIDFFRSTDQMINDFVQGQTLQRLNAGVDIERFMADSQYKKDTVLGLAMSADETVVELSINLAKKYEIPLWEVYMTHLQFLFDTSDMDTENLRRLIEKRKVISFLKQNPSRFVSNMEENVLDNINGKNHDRLILYYSLLAEGSEEKFFKQKIEAYLKILTQIKDVASNLDFKSFLKPNADSLEVLKPVLSETNVDILAKVAQCIPKSEGFALEPSMVYCAWAQKLFFTSSSKGRPHTSSEWIRRFDEIEEIFEKMRPMDINFLIRSLVFSEESISTVPLEARKDIIVKAALYCKKKCKHEQNDSELDSWTEANLVFGKLEKHLELLRSETFKTLADSPDLKLREYAHQFILSGGDEESLESLARKVLLDLCPLEHLRSLLAVYPDYVEQVPEDIYMGVIRCTLERISRSNDTSSLNQECINCPFEVLSHLLKQLKDYCDDGGDLLGPEEVFEEIRNFAEDVENPLADRVRVLSIAQQYFPLSESDQRLFQAMKTGGIVRDNFSSPQKENKESKTPIVVNPSEVDTEDGRKELFKTLIEKMDSAKKAKSIVELLKFWPPFDPQIYSDLERNPFMEIFLKLLSSSKLKSECKDCVNLIYSTVNGCLAEKQITSECISKLIEKLLELPAEDGLKCSYKLALQGSFVECEKKCLEKYSELVEINDSHYDKELFNLIVEKDAVSAVLPTCLYGPLFTYLIEGEDPDLLRRVFNRLEEADMWIEAASLAVLSSSMPRALKTVSTTLNTHKKWLQP